MGARDTSVKGYRGMAECLRKMGNYEKSIVCCREGLAIFPADSALWDTLTACYERMNRSEQVWQVQEERRKELGDNEDYYSNIADTLIQMGKTGDGLAVYDNAKRSYFKRAADRQELAELYMEWDAIRGQPGKIQSGMACGEKLLYGRETRGSGTLGKESAGTPCAVRHNRGRLSGVYPICARAKRMAGMVLSGAWREGKSEGYF